MGVSSIPAWKNPMADKRIESLDVISENVEGPLLLFAVTAELAK